MTIRPIASRGLSVALALGLFAVGSVALGMALFTALFWNSIDLINQDGTPVILTATDAVLMTLLWVIIGADAVRLGVRVVRRSRRSMVITRLG